MEGVEWEETREAWDDRLGRTQTPHVVLPAGPRRVRCRRYDGFFVPFFPSLFLSLLFTLDGFAGEPRRRVGDAVVGAFPLSP